MEIISRIFNWNDKKVAREFDIEQTDVNAFECYLKSPKALSMETILRVFNRDHN